MSRIRLFILLLVLAATILLGSWGAAGGLALILPLDVDEEEGPEPPTEPPSGEAAEAPYVIIAVQDGARYSDTFGDPAGANIPHMRGLLRPEGTVLDRFYNRGMTLTDPGHASLITGTDQRLDNAGLLRPDRPTLFEYHRSHHPGLAQPDGWVVSGKRKLGILSHSRGGDGRGAAVDAFDGEDDQVWRDVQRIMDENQPSVIVANFPSTDRRGHEGDWDGYIGAIRNFDRLAYELWNKIQTSPHYRDKTLLVLTNDHGRSDYDWREHGDTTEGSRHIMFVALGPGVKKGFVSDRERSLTDVLPTIGRLMGCPMPEARGEVMEEILEERVPALAGSGYQSADYAD